MVLRGWQFLTSRPTVEGEYLSILPSPLIWLLSHTMWRGRGEFVWSLRRKPPFWFRAWGMDQGIAITVCLVGIDISCMMAIKLSDFFYL